MKTFEEKKSCFLEICDYYKELNKYKEEIQTSKKDTELEKIKTNILSLNLSYKSEIALKFNVCYNDYSAEKPYLK